MWGSLTCQKLRIYTAAPTTSVKGFTFILILMHNYYFTHVLIVHVRDHRHHRSSATQTHFPRIPNACWYNVLVAPATSMVLFEQSVPIKTRQKDHLGTTKTCRASYLFLVWGSFRAGEKQLCLQSVECCCALGLGQTPSSHGWSLLLWAFSGPGHDDQVPVSPELHPVVKQNIRNRYWSFNKRQTCKTWPFWSFVDLNCFSTTCNLTDNDMDNNTRWVQGNQFIFDLRVSA